MNDAATERSTALSIERKFDAPRALVWAVWTDSNHAMQWWGPHGFTTPLYEADVHPGGAFRVHMRAPDGTIYPSAGTFEEVVAPERIVTFGAVEIDGVRVFEARTAVTFEAQGGKTSVGVHQTYSKVSVAGAAAIAGAQQGWAQQFERLTAYLAGLER